MTTPTLTRPARGFTPGRNDWNLSTSAPLHADDLHKAIRDYKLTGDNTACNKVIQSHLRLVAKIARRFTGPRVPLDDLMAEGALALRRAMENYDPARGASFTSYASVTVEHAVRGAARSEYDHFKIPSRERRKAAVRQTARSKYFAQHGNWPSPAELQLAQTDTTTTTPLTRTAFVPTPPPRLCISLDAEPAGGIGYAHTLADDSPSPADRVAQRDDADHIAAALQNLPHRVSAAVKLRFGIDAESPRTIAEIAHELRISTAAAERLVLEGIRRLRSHLCAHVDSTPPRSEVRIN